MCLTPPIFNPSAYRLEASSKPLTMHRTSSGVICVAPSCQYRLALHVASPASSTCDVRSRDFLVCFPVPSLRRSSSLTSSCESHLQSLVGPDHAVQPCDARAGDASGVHELLVHVLLPRHGSTCTAVHATRVVLVACTSETPASFVDRRMLHRFWSSNTKFTST